MELDGEEWSVACVPLSDKALVKSSQLNVENAEDRRLGWPEDTIA